VPTKPNLAAACLGLEVLVACYGRAAGSLGRMELHKSPACPGGGVKILLDNTRSNVLKYEKLCDGVVRLGARGPFSFLLDATQCGPVNGRFVDARRVHPAFGVEKYQ
jgi:hypothetical protein